MKNAKKLISLFLAVCLLVVCLPLSASATTLTGSCGASSSDKVTWSFDTETGAMTISGTGKMSDYIITTVPWNNLPASIKTVTIGQGVTHVGYNSFTNFNTITSVSFANSVQSIGKYAFAFCPALSEVTLPESVATIGDYAFRGCTSLTKADIKGAITINAYAFCDCTSLTSLSLPDTLTTIGSYAFCNCSELTSVTIPESVTKLKTYAFSGCAGLRSINIPSKVTIIESYTFSGCTSLTSVEIPSKVNTIGAGAFDYCTSLKAIIIPEGVTNIGSTSEYGITLKSPNVIIYGVKGSYAQEYANYKKIPFREGRPSDYPDGEEPEKPETPEEPEEPEEPDDTEVNFDDVKDGEYYREPVRWAVKNDVTKGLSDTKFGPDDPCTRGQAVTFLWRAAGKPMPTKTTNPFKDVKQNDYYYNAVLWAVEKGITSGTSSNTFGPNDKCTRAQIVTFLWRLDGKPTPPKEYADQSTWFKDVNSPSLYYLQPVMWAVSEKITAGISKTHFGPNNVCTRGQIVTFLFRYITNI